MLVWFVYATKSQHATAQSHVATLSRDKVARRLRDKIAGVTSVLALHVAEAYVAHYRPTTKIKVKVKCARLHEECRRVLISLPLAVSSYVDKQLKSVMYDQCDARPVVTSPAAGHHRPLTDTKFTAW